MICFNNSFEFPIVVNEETENTVSTLLIPESLVDEFLFKRNFKYNKNTAAYLQNLLWMYRIITYSGLIPKARKVKTEYQEENQNLKRISFRPDNKDWIELGQLSVAFGKSRCWMFTYLLKLDFIGLWEILSSVFKRQVVPTTPEFELKSSLSLERASDNFTRFFHVKV